MIKKIIMLSLLIVAGCSTTKDEPQQSVRSELQQSVRSELPMGASILRSADFDGNWWMFEWRGHYYLYKRQFIGLRCGSYGPVLIEIEKHQYEGRSR